MRQCNQKSPFWPVVVAAGLLSLAARASSGDDQDPRRRVDVASRAWNGMDRFLDLARRSGLEVSLPSPSLELRPDRRWALLVVHPTVPLEDTILGFVRRGGTLVLLDDYGTSSRFLSRLGVERLGLPRDLVQTYQGHPNLVYAFPARATSLTTNVSRVLTNHASAYALPPGVQPVLAYERNGYFLAFSMPYGEGRIVGFADSSLFLNTMMDLPGNRTLARNLVDTLHAWGVRTLVVVAGASRIEGVGEPRPRSRGARGKEPSLLRRANEVLRRLNGVLAGLRPYPASLLLAAALLLGIWMAVLAARLPWAEIRYHTPWARRQHPVSHGFAARLEQLTRGEGFVEGPALEIFRRRLWARLAALAGTETTSRAALGDAASRLRQRRGLWAAWRYSRLLESLERLGMEPRVPTRRIQRIIRNLSKLERSLSR